MPGARRGRRVCCSTCNPAHLRQAESQRRQAILLALPVQVRQGCQGWACNTGVSLTDCKRYTRIYISSFNNSDRKSSCTLGICQAYGDGKSLSLLKRSTTIVTLLVSRIGLDAVANSPLHSLEEDYLQCKRVSRTNRMVQISSKILHSLSRPCWLSHP